MEAMTTGLITIPEKNKREVEQILNDRLSRYRGLHDALEAIGFLSVEDDANDVCACGFRFSSDYPAFREHITAIAHLIHGHQRMAWVDEDLNPFIWVFSDGKLHELYATVRYPDSSDIHPHCSHCGSRQLEYTAYVDWDASVGHWIIETEPNSDFAYCRPCQRNTLTDWRQANGR